MNQSASALLLLLILLAGAGCTGSTNDSPVIIPVQFRELSDIGLTKDEVPLPSLAFMTEMTPITANSEFLAYYGAKRAFTRQFSGGEIGGPGYIQLSQTIVEYPPGNATKAFARLKRSAAIAAPNTKPPVLWPDPKIGDESVGVSLPGQATWTRGGSTAIIVFRKSDIVEMIMLESSSPDNNRLAQAARNAAAKVP